MMTAVTKLALGLLAATTVAADSRLNLATNADGVEDPQPIFDYAATGACAAVDE